MIWWMRRGNHILFLGVSSVALNTIMGLFLVAWKMHTRSSRQWTVGQTEIMIKKKSERPFLRTHRKGPLFCLRWRMPQLQDLVLLHHTHCGRRHAFKTGGWAGQSRTKGDEGGFQSQGLACGREGCSHSSCSLLSWRGSVGFRNDPGETIRTEGVGSEVTVSGAATAWTCREKLFGQREWDLRPR